MVEVMSLINGLRSLDKHFFILKHFLLLKITEMWNNTLENIVSSDGV